MIHYFTTYGFEALGIETDYVYFPAEETEVSLPEAQVPVTYIASINNAQLFALVANLSSSVALNTHTLDKLMTIVTYYELPKTLVTEVTNRDFLGLLYDHFDMLPQEPVEFLRYVVQKATGINGLVKDQRTIVALRQADGKLIDSLMAEAPMNLSTIGLRYKVLFLAMRQASNNKSFFNKLMRDAKVAHTALPSDYLNDVTHMLQNGSIDWNQFESRVASATVWRKVRLAQALSFRLNNPTSIVHIIRNGKGYTQEFTWSESLYDDTAQALNVVMNSITEDVGNKVGNNRTVYIPKGVVYGLPATEKQFIGNLPLGSSVTVESNNMVVGVHWNNIDRQRVDIDLSSLTVDGKIGWNTTFRGNNLTHSGDNTRPGKNGACEVFEVMDDTSAILYVNDYTRVAATYNVPIKLFVAEDSVSKQSHGKYMVDASSIIAQGMFELDRNENAIGFIHGKTFYFAPVSLGTNFVSSYGPTSELARQYFLTRFTCQPTINEVLLRAGCKVVSELPVDSEEEVIDLSATALTKTSILDMME